MANGGTVFKQADVVMQLRDRIICGTLAPGFRLPTYDALEAEFAVSRGTLFQAIRELKQDGLLQSQGRRGVFVSMAPPHLTRYAFVLPMMTRVSDPLHSAYLGAANAMRRSGICEIAIFHAPDEAARNDEYRRLLGDVQAHRLAGVLFFGRPWPTFNLTDSPVLHADGVPCLAITAHEQPGITALRFDMPQAIAKGCQWLRERGRRRIAVLACGKIETLPQPMDLPALVRAQGIETRDEWCVNLGLGGEEAAGSLVKLMLDGRSACPDGLFLFDDHLLPSAARALIADKRIGVGTTFDVVSICNWPHIPETVLPIRWIGFDARFVLQQAINLIDRGRAGGTLPAGLPIPPFFAEERETAMAALLLNERNVL